MDKYRINIKGSPKRRRRNPTSDQTRTHSKRKKYHNLGPPQKVVVTPNTPRTRKWKELIEKDGYKQYEIGDYEPDDEDLNAIDIRRKRGIPTPTKYTNFEENVTRFMIEASRKKPLTDTDAIEQIDEEAWETKDDDPPLFPSPPKKRRGNKSRGRSRGRSRSRSRGRSRMQKRN